MIEIADKRDVYICIAEENRHNEIIMRMDMDMDFVPKLNAHQTGIHTCSLKIYINKQTNLCTEKNTKFIFSPKS